MEKESVNLMEKAYRLIRNMMLQQKLGSGQKLIYRDLSEKLGMSKTPIMYALGRLEQEGFIELVPNSGYSVKEIDVKEIEDLFDMREALETHAVALGVERKTLTGLKLLDDKVRQHKEYVTPTYDRKKLVLDAEVHLQIAQLSGNRVLLKLLRNVFEHLYLRSHVELMNPARLSVAPSEHLKILALLRKGGASGAEKIIRDHIQAAREAMVSCLCKQEELSTFTFQIE